MTIRGLRLGGLAGFGGIDRSVSNNICFPLAQCRHSRQVVDMC